MDKWISFAAKMTTLRDVDDLSNTFCEFGDSLGGISNCWVLYPCSQGRELRINADGLNLAWKVDDFSHPFSHVLQSASSMLLDPEKLNYWMGNDVFKTLAVCRQLKDSLLITPFVGNDGVIRAISVMTGTYTSLSEVLACEHWKHIAQIYSNQCAMITQLGQDSWQKNALVSSIAEIRENEHKREQAFELKKVLIGSSKKMSDMRDKVVKSAQSSLNVMICGETGTGKELVAKAVHELSVRKGKPFIAINCAAIPENLLESELFGHVKGAFSGAERAKSGLLAESDGGTLFLDEIGDMPISLQAKLLRVLETKVYRPVGGSKEIEVDFRLVSATHVQLEKKTECGEFRRDLYYRLNQFPIQVPALRERREDIPQLCNKFIESYRANQHVNVDRISYTALDLLSRHPFPGNVRELKNLIEYACTLSGNSTEISPCSISERLFEQRVPFTASNDESAPDNYLGVDIANINNLKAAVQNFEINVIRSRLTSFGGDRSKAAESLGLPKRTLAHKCLKMEID
ncbi:sigma-54 dependent transcriptional regulator [Enterovibrio sp. ZSDZ35]|uniref:Sigma-54 dependent transcriptional regulator n=1 Tax=Enterovibrio qingdaonensis TaxID=2899818 RepID=A0ABT5QJ60_9GAMM|nr:sigma-54 dependent transcriptional regulator [Enterovibrio sp. ZSDZ35]MDD1780510.1 sigma-54 dependent transcriptional regulator [Enterovibrio sp. ZSDZ35]